MTQHAASNETITVKIDYTDPESGQKFEAELSGLPSSFEKAATDKDITALEGPALFEALIAEYHVLPITAKYYTTEGLLHDSYSGEPALRRWHENGALSCEEYRQNGANGEPAIREWNENGTLTYWQRAGQKPVGDPAELQKIQKRENVQQVLKPFGDKLTLAM